MVRREGHNTYRHGVHVDILYCPMPMHITYFGVPLQKMDIQTKLQRGFGTRGAKEEDKISILYSIVSRPIRGI